MANSFSFWKMENLYGDSFTEITNLDAKNPEQIDWVKIKNYFCYDKHTQNWISLYINPTTDYEFRVISPNGGVNGPPTWNNLNSAKKSNFNFLNCDFNYENFWEADNLKIMNNATATGGNIVGISYWYSFSYKKESLNFNSDGSIKKENPPKNSIANLSKAIYAYYTYNPRGLSSLVKDSEFRYNHRIHFRKSFTSESGVEIENTDKGVILKKDDNNKNLDSLLKARWNNAFDLNRENFATSLINDYYLSSEEESIKKQKALAGMDKYNAFPMSAFELDRLNTCTILAVWCLIPVEVDAKDENGKDIKKIIESQMLGLAKDKDGNLFHWTTDLGKDISEFMLNIPKPSDNSTTDSSTSTSS